MNRRDQGDRPGEGDSPVDRLEAFWARRGALMARRREPVADGSGGPADDAVDAVRGDASGDAPGDAAAGAPGDTAAVAVGDPVGGSTPDLDAGTDATDGDATDATDGDATDAAPARVGREARPGAGRSRGAGPARDSGAADVAGGHHPGAGQSGAGQSGAGQSGAGQPGAEGVTVVVPPAAREWWARRQALKDAAAERSAAAAGAASPAAPTITAPEGIDPAGPANGAAPAESVGYPVGRAVPTATGGLGYPGGADEMPDAADAEAPEAEGASAPDAADAEAPEAEGASGGRRAPGPGRPERAEAARGAVAPEAPVAAAASEVAADATTADAADATTDAEDATATAATAARDAEIAQDPEDERPVSVADASATPEAGPDAVAITEPHVEPAEPVESAEPVEPAEPAEPEGGEPETRASRRAARDARLRNPVMPELSTERRPVMVAATAAYALLVGGCALAGAWALALAILWGGLVLAWGWPRLLGSSSRYGSSISLALCAVACPVAVALTPDEPYLRWVPAALAVALIAMFLHQLLRRDGRPRLTESITTTAAGLAVITVAVLLVPLARTLSGPMAVLAAMVGVAVSAPTDLLTRSESARRWMVPITLALGGIGGLLTALPTGPPAPAVGAVIGMGAAFVAHVLRRVLSSLVGVTSRLGQVTGGVASVCLAGVTTFLLARVYIG